MSVPEYFFDTNVFLRYFTRDHASTYRDCLALMRAIEGGKIRGFVSDLVLAELVWTLKHTYGFSKMEILPAITAIIHLQGIGLLHPTNPFIALDLFEEHNVKFIDTLIASYPQIQRHDMIIVSYDKDFDRLGVARKEPKELL